MTGVADVDPSQQADARHGHRTGHGHPVQVADVRSGICIDAGEAGVLDQLGPGHVGDGSSSGRR